MNFSLTNHFEGEGGIRDIWNIAFPLILSSAFEAFVLFANRLMLAKVSSLQMAAMLSGGLTCFTLNTFFLGLIGYSSAIIAHLYGARRKTDCSVVVFQAFILSLISYPIILALIPLGILSFKIAGHSPTLFELEKEYFVFSIIITSFFGLLRTPFSAFFAGLGRTGVILKANLAGMLVNLISAYILIFGKFGFTAYEIRGAAVAIALSSAINLLVLLYYYFKRDNWNFFSIKNSFKLDFEYMRKIFKFGLPAGIESLFNLIAFTAMVSIFHSYGDLVASAVTVAFNWDIVSFVPMVGMQVAVTTLVGQNLGRGNQEAAIRSVYSGAKVITVYSLFIILLFLSIPNHLADLFRPDEATNWEQIRSLAIPMIMMMSVYPFSDGMLVVFSGAVRGAGDTKWAMFASAIFFWSAAFLIWIAVKVLQLPPLKSWLLFVSCFPVFGLIFFLRFKSGRWRGKEVIPIEPISTTENVQLSSFHTME